MSTKYILDITGSIKKQNDSEEYNSVSVTDISSNISSEIVKNEYEDLEDLSKDNLIYKRDSKNNDVILSDSDFRLSVNDSEDFKKSIVNKRKNDPSFGTGGENTGTRDSFKPMYHFSDENGEYFAKEFEMLTGYTGNFVGDESNSEGISGFIFSYFAEIFVLIGLMEGIALINSAIASLTSNNTSTVEKYHLTMGKYSIVEYDIFSTFLFSTLNYPKSDSTFSTRMVSFFVGFAAWFAPDNPIYLEKIAESISRNLTGTKNKENFYDIAGIKNEDFGLVLTPALHLGIAVLEILASSNFSTSSRKRLALLTKKFRQERIWKNNLFKAKKSEGLNLPNEGGGGSNFLVQFDYYYVRFAIERMNVGLKLINRYAHEKTYLNPSYKEGPLTRVSGHRTNYKIGNKINSGTYTWSQNNSDSKGYKPGMTTRLRSVPQLLNLSKHFSDHLSVSSEKAFQIDESIMQNFYKQEKEEARRIPKEVVKELEDYLESEYVPFYMHDLRTNEVLSFHAFIESISDAFTPEYTSASGFGRIDDVRSYVKTTRNINMSFTVAATSETDHDFMWYQINKLVTMVYPQWSEGLSTTDSATNQEFTFPFTQVPTASPLIRIRLGDVLKNNYSRSSLSRLFGLNATPISPEPPEPPPKFELLPGLYKVNSQFTDFSGKQYVEIKNPVVAFAPDLNAFEALFSADEKEIDISEAHEIVKVTYNGETIELIVDSSRIRKLEKSVPVAQANPNFTEIMKPFTGDGNDVSNNPITNSYESGMSRGLAGFITQLDVNYNESNWETSRIGSKAPMLVKVTLNFAPIHDIPPGIDHNGMMRAPVYNVGRVNNQMFGDSHDNENGIGSGLKPAIKKYDLIKKATEE